MKAIDFNPLSYEFALAARDLLERKRLIPAFFCVRHSLELALKELVRAFAEATEKELPPRDSKLLEQEHDLAKLSDLAVRVGLTQTDLPSEELASAVDFIVGIEGTTSGLDTIGSERTGLGRGPTSSISAIRPSTSTSIG